MASTILCIDDEAAAGAALERILVDIGYRPVLCASIRDGIDALSAHSVDLIISACATGDQRVVELLDHVRDAEIPIPVIVTTEYATIEHAVQMMRCGAADYLTRPLRAEGVRLAVRGVMAVNLLRRQKEELAREIAHSRAEHRLVGRSPAMTWLREEIAAVAPTRATVLIEGESGTGKELVAQAIHQQSPRHDRAFITLNCAALPDGLVESALFGHERGAFTGAAARSTGAFERADGATLLLDEISEMRLDLQAKLLRAIQEQEIERVGGQGPVRVNVRILATTNRDLKAEVSAGRFREDLFFRLAVVPLRTPPLRSRRDDIPLLVEHLLQRHAGHHGVSVPALDAAALAPLLAHSWPGNVRELSNVVERALIFSRGGSLGAHSFAHLVESRTAPAERGHGTALGDVHRSGPEDDVFDLETLERRAIVRALAATHGRRARAAKLLGISERTLRNKLNGERRSA